MNIDKKILITGGNGVLGYGLKRALTQRGYVNVLAPSKKELNALDQLSVNSYFDINKPDYVFHLASLVYGLQGNLDNQFTSLCSNTLINQNVLQACKSNNVEKIFFAGTVASYEYPYRKLPLEESFSMSGDPHFGEYGYAMAKRHALSYLKILKEYHGIDYCYGLFTNLFGPNDKFDIKNGHVIPSLIEKAISNVRAGEKKLKVWGRPETTRDFLYSFDAGHAAVHAFDNYSGIINIASGIETSIKDVVDAINLYFENNLVLEWDPKSPIGVPRRSVNIDKLLSTGYQPSLNLNKNIAETIDWYLNNLSGIRK
ncbi:NAD-dependent epimerase/dehydratase family protein [Acerihabitans sp. KWT182]|uniref:NAD-dependent epimerase/dehydratase family protein n=1 Tax=Acerihabitans sp. KWT182 TaxID=3157919 RepID=A0AAU7Q6F4_9GAMM